MSAYAEKESYGDLFKGKFCHITPVLWVAWFTDVFVYYGLIFMVPYTIQQQNHSDPSTKDPSSKADIIELYWGSLAEMPAFFVTWYLADHPMLGRRRSLILSFSGTAVCMGLLLILGYDALIWTTAVAKFFIGMAFILSYQYTLEIYNTNNRVTGLGTCSALGRIGGIMMPIISIFGT